MGAQSEQRIRCLTARSLRSKKGVDALRFILWKARRLPLKMTDHAAEGDWDVEYRRRWFKCVTSVSPQPHPSDQ